MKLRSKLLFATLALILIPVATLSFLKSMDSWLVERERDYLGERVQNLAAGISPFMQQWSTVKQVNKGYPVFPKQLTNLPVLDGFDSEWETIPANWISVKNAPMKILLGKAGKHQYLFLSINDFDADKKIEIKLHYQNTVEQPNPDNLEENIVSEENQIYIISPEAPGKIIATNKNNSIQSRLNGFWQIGLKNASLELRIPEDMILSRLKIRLKIATKKYASDWLQIFKTATEQQQLLELVNLASTERLWLLGPAGEVMGIKGDLQAEITKSKSNAFLSWLIGTVPETVDDPWNGVSQIPQSLIKAAREEGVNSRIEPGVNAQQKRIVALARIGTHENPQGYLLFEKLSGTSLLLSQPQLGNLVNITLGLMVLTIATLLFFAARLSWRIRQLQKQLSSSMDEQGRVTNIHLASNSRDEIGQLSRAMTKILYRQKEYQDYQHRMSSRLSHELRTPLAVVRGALDNLRPVTDAEDSILLVDRATTGIERMASLVTRMREAARLEQVISASVTQSVDIDELLKQITSGLCAAWPDFSIKYQSNETPSERIANVAPELIAQAIEKLIANAIDFAEPNSEIKISLEVVEAEQNKQLFIAVSNIGITLPKGKEQQLTDNMVSIRSQTHSDSAHLGLGLYMVQLIAQFHQGKAEIRNLEDDSGVIAGFSIKFIV